MACAILVGGQLLLLHELETNLCPVDYDIYSADLWLRFAGGEVC